MDDNLYERLSRIDDELIQLGDWLNDRRDFDTPSRLIPITDDLTHLVAEISARKNRQDRIARLILALDYFAVIGFHSSVPSTQSYGKN